MTSIHNKPIGVNALGMPPETPASGTDWAVTARLLNGVPAEGSACAAIIVANSEYDFFLAREKLLSGQAGSKYSSSGPQRVTRGKTCASANGTTSRCIKTNRQRIRCDLDAVGEGIEPYVICAFSHLFDLRRQGLHDQYAACVAWVRAWGGQAGQNTYILHLCGEGRVSDGGACINPQHLQFGLPSTNRKHDTIHALFQEVVEKPLTAQKVVEVMAANPLLRSVDGVLIPLDQA